MTVIESPDEQGRAPRATAPWSAVGLRWTAFVLAAGAATLLWLDSRSGWLDVPTGWHGVLHVRPSRVLRVLVVGAFLAIRWEIAGGVVTAFGAGAIGAMAVHQLVGWHAALVILLLASPARSGSSIDLLGRPKRFALMGLASALVVAGVGAGVGEYVYEGSFGPTHPPSDAPAPPESGVRWVWSGGVTSTGAEVRARLREPVVARLAVSTDADFTDVTFQEPVGSTRRSSRSSSTISGRGSSTATRWRWTANSIWCVRARSPRSRRDPHRSRSPSAPAPGSGRTARCSTRSVPRTSVFHLIAGDFHYGDIRDDDRERYDEVIDLTLRQPAQAALYRSVPIAYVWDDHDYGANDADAFSPSRTCGDGSVSSQRAELPARGCESSAIYQSFDVGRVRFLITDARSARGPGDDARRPSNSRGSSTRW